MYVYIYKFSLIIYYLITCYPDILGIIRNLCYKHTLRDFIDYHINLKFFINLYSYAKSL